MSKSKRERPSPFVYRWQEGGRYRSRSFKRAGDRDAFAAEVERRKQLGPMAAGVIQSKQTVAEFMEAEWWPRYAIPNLGEDTRRRYLEVWGTDLLPRVGGYELRELTPMIIEDLRDDLKAKGLSVATQRKTLLLLSGILKRAVSRGLIPENPVARIDMPKTPPSAPIMPLEPLTVERIRANMRRPRDRMLVSLMAYAGVRPMEDRSASWGDVQNRTLRVVASKKHGHVRYVDLLAPLAQDLAEWRMACGRPGPNELIVPRVRGGAWGREDWGNWRERIYKPAAIAAGVVDDLRPYRLRASFVSLLLWSGEDLVYVAAQAGHSVATLARHYAGVIAELRGQSKRPAADVIRDARITLSDAILTPRSKAAGEGE